MNKLTFVSTLALFALALTAPVQAETVNCTAITSLPYTISAPGAYCLTGHLSTSVPAGPIITIDTDKVVLDLNGFSIDGSGAGLRTFATGIYVTSRKNITIKNGTLRGFFTGIHLTASDPIRTAQGGNVIEDMRVEQSTVTGMYILGGHNIIRNNQVVATGGAPFPATIAGIYARGNSLRVLNNDVIDVASREERLTYGIHLNYAPYSMVAGNRVSNITVPSWQAYGIHLNDTKGTLVSDNRVSGATVGISFVSSLDGEYMNNMTHDIEIGYSGGKAAGTTNY